MSLSLAGRRGSACIGMQLYLNEEWAEDRKRRAASQIPEGIEFKEKWRIALDLLASATEWGVKAGIVLGDAGYGNVTAFREELALRGHVFALGIGGTQVVWLPAHAPKKSQKFKRGWTQPAQAPVVVRDLAPHLRFRKVTWREGTKGKMSSRFAALRVVPASTGRPPGDETWLLVEWPEGEAAPTKYSISNLPVETTVRQLVSAVKLRWRIERDYQEMKEELGLDHYEGRKWFGFHHHAALCAASHAFLALQRALFPPA